MESEKLGPVATRVLFENDDVKVWEMDLQPGDVCGLHRHTMDYVLYILNGARVGVESPGHKPYSFKVKARGTYFVPAGGVESAHNVGDTRFHEALVELKRKPRPGAEKLGFVGCEAVAGKDPEPGVIVILDNERVRVSEATLPAGAESGAKNYSHDAVMFVAEGAPLKIIESAEGSSERVREEAVTVGSAMWLPRGTRRNFVNAGSSRYRHMMVELK